MGDSEGYFGRAPDYFGDDYWGGSPSYWGEPLGRYGKFETVLTQMEKVNIGSYVFEAGCVEPGVDNADTPLRRILSNLEK